MNEAEKKRLEKQFETAELAAEGLYDKVENFTNTTPKKDIVETLSDLTNRLTEMYSIAERTVTTDDDFATEDLQNRLFSKLATYTFIPPEVTEYFTNRLVIVRADRQFNPNSQIQTDIVRQANLQLTTAAASAAALGWAEVGKDKAGIDTIVARATAVSMDNKNEKEKYEGTSGNQKSILELSQSINKAIFIDPYGSEIEEITKHLPDLIRYAGIVTEVPGVKAEQMLDPDHRRSLQQMASELAREKIVWHSRPIIYAEIEKMEQVIQRVLHEDKVIQLGRGTKDRDEYLRPSTKEIKSDVYGEMMAFLGSLSTEDIDRAESLGMAVAHKAEIQSADVKFLEDLRDEIQMKREKNILLRIQAGGLTGDADTRVDLFYDEVGKYVTWLNRLIAEAQVAPAGQKQGLGSVDVDKLANDADVVNFMKVSWAGLMHNLVTNTYSRDKHTAWDIVLRERGERDFVNAPQVKELVKKMRDVQDFGIYNTEIFNLSYLTAIQGDALKKYLSGAEGIQAYDSLRESELYQRVVKKITDRAYQIMLDYYDENYGANQGKNKGWELIQESMYQLCGPIGYPPFTDRLPAKNVLPIDPDVKAAMDEIPDEIREDIRVVIMRCAHYDASLRALRQKAALVHLGKKRAAFKFTDSTEVGAYGRLDMISYKVGKNNDKGTFSSDLAWIDLPHDLETAGPKGQTERFEDRQHTEGKFLNLAFGDRRVEKLVKNLRWKPAKRDAIALHLDDFLLYKDRYNRGRDTNYGNFSQTNTELEKVFDKASKCWSSPQMEEFAKLDDEAFELKISKEIGDIGSAASKVLAYIMDIDENGPHGEDKLEMMEALRAAIDFYIIYLFAQIKFEFADVLNVKTQARYSQRHSIMKNAIIDFFVQNGSFEKPFARFIDPATGTNQTLLDHFIETASNPLLRKSTGPTKAIFREFVIGRYNLAETWKRVKDRNVSRVPATATPTTFVTLRKVGNTVLTPYRFVKEAAQKFATGLGVDLAQMNHMPHWPYAEISSKSAKEGEK